MPAYKKNIVISIVAIFIIGCIFLCKEFYRGPEDITDSPPQQIISAAEIIRSYNSDEKKADSLFLGKVISVTGPIAEIYNQNDTLIYVLLGNNNDLNKVSCLLDKHQSEKIKQFTEGKNISIKGICTGFLIDVELNRCVIVSQTEK